MAKKLSDPVKTSPVVRPLGIRLLVRNEDAAEKTPGGILLPDSAKTKPNRGTVVRIGPKVADVKEGQTVLFGRYAGLEFDPEDKSLVLLKEEDVLATVGD